MREVSTERLTQIADEIFDLTAAPGTFGFLDEDIDQALERRLQEIMMGRQSLECMELAMYLRTTFSRRDFLPTWQPLLNVTVELIRGRGEDLDMLYGLVPRGETVTRNTDGMSGNKHPQMQRR